MRQRDQFAAPALFEIQIPVHEDGRIGVAEAVDRLFDIADHVDVVTGDAPDKALLQVVGILVFIDQDLVETFRDFLSYFLILFDQIDRHAEDVVETVLSAFSLEGGQSFMKFFAQAKDDPVVFFR